MFPPFASSAGIPASGLRYESDDARVIHPLPHNINYHRIRGEEGGIYE